MQSSVDNTNLSNVMLIDYSRSIVLLKVMVVQVLVGIFLCVNCLMIFTVLNRAVFREDTRYILFAQMLFVDTSLMVLTDLLMLVNLYQYPSHMIPCIILYLIIATLNSCTPLTLVAMCLERYVAICMPLRHANISTRKTRCFGFLIIWGISSITPLFTCISYFSTTPASALFSYAVCTVQLKLETEWQAQTRVTILLLLFFFMIIIIAFTYIKIMIAAKAASSENKASTNKSLRTVVLHAFQLFLCIMQLLKPYVEMVFWKIDVALLNNIKYCNFIIFIIAPRCLSPLIYGLRDKQFFLVLKHNTLCGHKLKTRPSSQKKKHIS